MSPGPNTTDCEYALQLRNAFAYRHNAMVGIEVGAFDNETKTANITFPAVDRREQRIIRLRVASVYEVEVDD